MSDETKDKLVKSVKLGVNSPSINSGGFGLRGALQQAKAVQPNTTAGINNTSAAKDRIIIVADDSGSMSGEPFEQQKTAIKEFLAVCSPIDTAVGVVPMNMPKIPLTLVHTLILSKVLGWNQEHLGSTPTFDALSKALEDNPTRVVLISDGGPTDGKVLTDKAHFQYGNGYYERSGPKEGSIDLSKWQIHPIIEKYRENKISIDTVYIGPDDKSFAKEEMRAVAELTGGMYIFFKEGESFAKKFKYLAPAFYAQLTAGSIKI